MGSRYVSNSENTELTINTIELFILLKRAGEESFKLEDFYQFYESLTDQEKQILPKRDKLKELFNQMSTHPIIKALEKNSDNEYTIIDPPHAEQYDAYFIKKSKKEVYEQLNKLCEKYILFFQKETLKKIASIQDSIKNSNPTGNFILNLQDFFDYLFIAMVKQGITSLNKTEFLDYFTPHNPSLLSLKLDLRFNRIFPHDENTKKIINDYFEKSRIYSFKTDEDYFYIIPNEEKEDGFSKLNQEDSEILNDIIDRYMKKKPMLPTEQEMEPIHR